jgi:hypothetical protein
VLTLLWVSSIQAQGLPLFKQQNSALHAQHRLQPVWEGFRTSPIAGACDSEVDV